MERRLLQYRVAFGLVLLGIVVAIGVVVRASIRIHALGSNPSRAAIGEALAGGNRYVNVAVAAIVIGAIIGVITTLRSPSSQR